jgi:hypothetical protein
VKVRVGYRPAPIMMVLQITDDDFDFVPQAKKSKTSKRKEMNKR